MALAHAEQALDAPERQSIRAEIAYDYDAPVHGTGSLTWSQADFPPDFPKLRKHLAGYGREGYTVRSVEVWELKPGGAQIPFNWRS